MSLFVSAFRLLVVIVIILVEDPLPHTVNPRPRTSEPDPCSREPLRFTERACLPELGNLHRGWL